MRHGPPAVPAAVPSHPSRGGRRARTAGRVVRYGHRRARRRRHRASRPGADHPACNRGARRGSDGPGHTASHALPAGSLSAFVDGAFVDTTSVYVTAPGAELELHLGVERGLMELAPHRALLGGKISAVERWRITVHTGRPSAVHLVVRERVPVSRHPDVQVVDVDVKPDPAGRDELGRREWTASVEAGGTWEASVRFGVRHARDASVVGRR